jgi:uncharacterized protein YjiS (DUF1127 family)
MKALVFLRLFGGAMTARDLMAEKSRRAMGRSLVRQAGPAWRPFSLWRRRLSDERLLQSVSDHVLKDIGFRPHQRSSESSRRFRR